MYSNKKFIAIIILKRNLRKRSVIAELLRIRKTIHMACNPDFIQYIIDQCSGAGEIAVKKMMGELISSNESE